MVPCFHDSDVVTRMHFERMKAEIITMKVFGRKTVPDTLDDLSPTGGEHVHFSAATYASNERNRKMFPVCMRYFSVSDGVQCKLLDFYEDSDETANGIHQALMKCLDKHELDRYITMQQIMPMSTLKNTTLFTSY